MNRTTITLVALVATTGCDLGDPHPTHPTKPSLDYPTWETPDDPPTSTTGATPEGDTSDTSDITVDPEPTVGSTVGSTTGDSSTGDDSVQPPDDSTNSGTNPTDPLLPGNDEHPPFHVYPELELEYRPFYEDPAHTGRGVHVADGWLVDDCGNTAIVKGLEQPLGVGIDVDGSYVKLIEEIGKTGANSVRLLVNQSPFDGDGAMSVDEMDDAIGQAVEEKMLVFVSPGYAANRCEWFQREDVKAVLQSYGNKVVIDAYAEPDFDDRDEWVAEVTVAIECVRDAGYTQVLNVLANDWGRDGLSLFDRGEEIVAADPLGQVILGWQAYWGQSRFIEEWWGTNIHDMAKQISDFRREKKINIQLGLLHWADPGDPMDYVTAMNDAEALGIGWLWWEFYNPFNWHGQDDVSWDGKVDNLRPHGNNVFWALSMTAQEFCF